MQEWLKYVFIIGIGLAAAGSQYLLKIGVTQQQISLAAPWQTLLKLVQNTNLIMAAGFYVLAFALYMFLLVRADVSYLYPVTQGLNFVLIFIMAWLLLNESITPQRVLGMAVIIIGIYIVESS